MGIPNVKNSRYIVVSHVYAMGPAFQLVEYLRPRVAEVIFIGHPFPYAKDTRSFLRVYRQGKLIQERFFWQWGGPDLGFYLKDALLTLWWAFPHASSAIYVGVNNLNALVGYVLKILGLVKTLIFYTIDYIPQRFPNPMLNRLYHWMDRTVVRVSDSVWNLSAIMAQERGKRGVAPRYQQKQIVVPIGTVMDSDQTGSDGPPLGNVAKSQTPTIVFMGHVRPGQGVETLLEAMNIVLKKVPDAQLVIIGGGPLVEPLKDQAAALKISSHVTFTGFIEKFSDMMKLLRQATVAVAPYVDDEQTFTRYTDPGKPKDYLASGLPVVITKVPQVAWEIDHRRCGLAVDDTPEDIARAIVEVLANKELREEFQRNALLMAADYTWDKVFDRALAQTFARRTPALGSNL